MSKLVRLFIRNHIIGFGLALVFTGGILALDVGHLRHLVLHVQGGYLAAFLLFFFSGIVFAGAQTAIAVFLMAAPEDTAPPRGPAVSAEPAPIPVSAISPARRR